jgi:hypothetical protein
MVIHRKVRKKCNECIKSPIISKYRSIPIMIPHHLVSAMWPQRGLAIPTKVVHLVNCRPKASRRTLQEKEENVEV